jgi:cold shock CspA family protein
MTTGTITRLTDRGFGFIQPDAPEPAPVVVRASGLRAPLTLDALAVGQAVEFEIAQDAAGRHQAVDVRGRGDSAGVAGLGTPTDQDSAAQGGQAGRGD